jgi:hypothetical protein
MRDASHDGRDAAVLSVMIALAMREAHSALLVDLNQQLVISSEAQRSREISCY